MPRSEEPKRDDYAPCSCRFETEEDCGGCEEYSYARSSYWHAVNREIDEGREDREEKDQAIQERGK